MEDELNKKFEELVSKFREYNENVNIEILKAAYEFAKVAHGDVKRLSGEIFLLHPLETALILASWKMDLATIVAGLLHDSIEHGAANKGDIITNFGEEIFRLVDGVTQTSKVKLKGSSDEVFVENLRKMFLAISKDLRIVFLRLAERLSNLKSLEFLSKERQLAYAKESLEIYAPLAERLGMWQVKTKIEDLAFKFAFPDKYSKTINFSKEAYKNAEQRIFKMKRKLLADLNKHNVNAEILGRKKGIYSLYNKLSRDDINWDFDFIKDIVAMRILVNTIKECYIALGILHKHYKSLPGHFNDYIAAPKPNGYRSIHTKVYGEEGKKVEIQIRTFEMHHEAEHGVASHWQMEALKSKGKLNSEQIDKGEWKTPENKLNWVKELASWQKEISDSDEFLKAVKFDALAKRIFVFTPKGDVYDLPENATPVDFAYAVHTGLGEYVKGAMVDQKIVPLDFILKNGQVVEILKSKEKKKPNQDWLGFVVSTIARREIKKQLKKLEKVNH